LNDVDITEVCIGYSERNNGALIYIFLPSGKRLKTTKGRDYRTFVYGELRVEKDKDGRTEEGIKLAEKSLEIVNYFQPQFWALENPVGRIHKLVPKLGKAKLIFNPCDYGDAYTKKTCLWGNFNIPEKNPVEPIYYYSKDKRSSWIWKNLGGKSERTKELRSQTPMGFSKAFFNTNP